MASPDVGTSLARGFQDISSIRWPLVRSNELFALKYGKALVESNRRPGPIPVFGTNGRCGHHDTPLFKGPGVVLGRKGQGPLGVEYVDADYWVIDTAYALERLRSDVDLKFSYYLIKYVGLNHLKDGTSNPTLSRDSFGAQYFPFPPAPAQRAIARILGAFDEKIELNRQMNETLEAMARALFKSWFVDFDPVRAKLEGRAPAGMDAETAKLFPGSFEDSPLGPIPKGWRVGTLGDLVQLRRGHDLPSASRQPGPIPIVSSSGVSGFHSVAQAKAPGIVTGRYGTIGKVFLVEEDYWPLNTTLYSADLKRNDVTYVYFALQEVDFDKFSDKGAVPGINRNHLHTEPMVLPSSAVQTAFGRILDPWRKTQRLHTEETKSLTAVRDTLLPKLLSGEFRVSDAERVVASTLHENPR